jgi:hypothetical protein
MSVPWHQLLDDLIKEEKLAALARGRVASLMVV